MLSKTTPERLVRSNLFFSFRFFELLLVFGLSICVSWLVFPGVCDCVSEFFGFIHPKKKKKKERIIWVSGNLILLLGSFGFPLRCGFLFQGMFLSSTGLGFKNYGYQLFTLKKEKRSNTWSRRKL